MHCPVVKWRLGMPYFTTMRFTTFIVFFFCISLNFLHAQTRFFKYLDGWKSTALAELDSTYVVFGTGSTEYSQNYLEIHQMDKTGNLLSSWIHPPDSLISTELRNQQSFHNYENTNIVGVTVITPQNELRAKRLRLSSNITHIVDSSWTYSTTADDAIMFITEQINENEILHAIGTINNGGRMKFISTDTLGNSNWEVTYECGNTCYLRPVQIIPVYDGGYILTVIEQKTPNGGNIYEYHVASIIKTDSIGMQEWQMYPGGQGTPITSDYLVAFPTDDGNYLCSWSDIHSRGNNGIVNNNPDRTIWFAKITPNGDKIWEKNIAEELSIWNINQTFHVLSQAILTPDNHIVISSLGILIKITQDAEVVWIRNTKPEELNPDTHDVSMYLHGIINTTDGGFLCSGEILRWVGGFIQTGYALKLDEYGCLEEGCHLDDPVVNIEEVVEKTTNISIYPNPTNHDININYQLPYNMPDYLTLFISDIMGKVVYTQTLHTYENNIRIELDKNLLSGTYFCHLIADGQSLGSKRFVLIR